MTTPSTVEAFDAGTSRMTLDVKNEFLVVRIGQVVASVPDLITIVDDETTEPINAEWLRYGQRVSVLGIGAPPQLRTPAALAVVEPRSFGFDLDFVPIDALHPGSEGRKAQSSAAMPAMIASLVNSRNLAVSKPTTRFASVSMITRCGESRNLRNAAVYLSSGFEVIPDSVS